MTEKRFYLLNYNNYPIYDSLLDEEYNAQFRKQREKICDLLNEINDTNKKFGEERWAIMKLIIEYDTTKKYSEKEVIEKIKDIMGLVMI